MSKGIDTEQVWKTADIPIKEIPIPFSEVLTNGFCRFCQISNANTWVERVQGLAVKLALWCYWDAMRQYVLS